MTLSKSRVAPGEYITIEHEGITAGLPVTVEFTGPDGSVVRVESYDVEQGRVGVAVPPVYDSTTATIGAGQLTVSIERLTGETAIDVDDLPTLPGVEPGAVLAIFLEAAIENHQRTLTDLATIEAQVGPGASEISTDAITAEITRLQGTLDELETTGQLVVNLEGLGVATLTPELLHLGDRWLVSMLTPPTAAAASKRSSAHRDVAECLAIDAPSGFDRAACLREVVSDIGTATLPWIETAGRVATGVGVVVTVVGATAGLVAGTPVIGVLSAATAANIAVTGLYVSISSGTISVVAARLQGKNVDAFLQDSGEDFNLGLEILSQMGRVLFSAAATGFEPLENIFSDFATWWDRFVTGMDAYASYSCSNDGSQKSIQPRAVSIGFCSAVRPPGCDNSCVLSFDGLCDDGGPGSHFSVCALGTDCSDCGPRDPSPQPSDDPQGACCEAGGCFSRTADACDAQGGAYLGGGSVCDPNPCATAEPTVEYVVWYTANVSCWSAPLLYITDRAGFDRAEIASSYPGGGIDPNIPLVKTELQGGFASVEDARAWICPQFVSRFSHAWCSQYYQTGNCNWQPGGLGCDLSALPFTDTLPAGTNCP